ncbi:MAG: light-harvesting protein [Pseudomonadota bacterium]
MNNSRIWLVVNPTVGVPIFLGAVAVGSFAVHLSILSNTTWVADFLAGRELGSSAVAAQPVAEEATLASAEGAKVYFDSAAAEGEQKAVVVLEDGRVAHVVFDDPLTTASADIP